LLPVNLVTRKGKFDAAHRVLHERFKCFNLHGHEYHYELTFSWSQPKGLGYAIDFKEIKRLVGEWIDERMDHGFIANPVDNRFISACRDMGLKIYLMHARDEQGFCNPSAENIAKELYFAGAVLLNDSDLKMHSVKLWETTNCYVECHGLSSTELELLYHSSLHTELLEWKKNMGVVEYDDRRVALQGVASHEA